MNWALRILSVNCVVFTLAYKSAMAAEGGYSNYVPGTYGDFSKAQRTKIQIYNRKDRE